MLGSLARWLRVLGLDVLYDASLDDPELVAIAATEGRTLLTRDRGLVARRDARDHLLIRSERIEEQVRQVLEDLRVDLDPARPFGRCLRCNQVLVDLPRQEALAQVPPYVASTQRRFRQCPACGRVFWSASHVRRMRERLRAMGVGI